MTNFNLVELNEQFANATPEEILAWAWESLQPWVAVSSSFQTQSIPLLHLISLVCPDMPIIFLDTGFHFPETLTFRDELQEKFDLNIVNATPQIDKTDLTMRHGEALYRRDPDLCCYINKVEPMERAIGGLAGWISGVRADQTAHRRTLSIFEQQSDGLLKIHPLLNWTKKDLWVYIDTHKLPPHPLFSSGYLSVGCAPCTRPVYAGEDERAGRWANNNKTECGLHIQLNVTKTEVYSA